MSNNRCGDVYYQTRLFRCQVAFNELTTIAHILQKFKRYRNNYAI